MRAREVTNRDRGERGGGGGEREGGGGRKRVRGDERRGGGETLTHRLKILFAEKVG